MSESNNGFVDFKAIKQSVSMLQVLEYYGLTQNLKRNGDSLSGPCPLHGGHTEGQFKVSVSKNCWNCFGKCKSGGNILDFVSRKENVGIREAAILILKWFDLSADTAPDKQTEKTKDKNPQSQKDPKESAAPESQSKENKPLGFSLKYLDPNHTYLTERGLSPETIITFGLGFCNKGILTGRIAIPVHNLDGGLWRISAAGREHHPKERRNTNFPKVSKNRWKYSIFTVRSRNLQRNHSSWYQAYLTA